MTQHQRRVVKDSIAECERYIAKESPRAADLRPDDVAKRLEFYIQHRLKLLAMLETESQTDAVG